MRLVHHKNIVKLVDVFEDRTHMYIILELLRGGNLFNKTALACCKPMEDRMVANVIEHLADALSYLHKLGIIHRDLKVSY